MSEKLETRELWKFSFHGNSIVKYCLTLCFYHYAFLIGYLGYLGYLG